MLSIRLPEALEQRLDYLAQKTGRTKSYYAREAIVDHIDNLEDIYLALHRLENPGKKWSLDDVEQARDLES